MLLWCFGPAPALSEEGWAVLGSLTSDFLWSLNIRVLFCWVLVWQGKKEELGIGKSSTGEPLAAHGQWLHSHHPLTFFRAQWKQVAHHCPWQPPGPITPLLGRNWSAVLGQTEAGRKSGIFSLHTHPPPAEYSVSWTTVSLFFQPYFFQTGHRSFSIARGLHKRLRLYLFWKETGKNTFCLWMVTRRALLFIVPCCATQLMMMIKEYKSLKGWTEMLF